VVGTKNKYWKIAKVIERYVVSARGFIDYWFGELQSIATDIPMLSPELPAVLRQRS
jgi:hypothetical protein